MEKLRVRLVQIAREWEQAFGNAPSITSALSEFDAAMLVGLTESDYSKAMQGSTAVTKGHDFTYRNKRYQVKGNRPSGKPGSKVSLVPKARNYEWDYLIWILYDPNYVIQEAWLWEVNAYKNAFHEINRLSPAHMRRGTSIFRAMPKATEQA